MAGVKAIAGISLFLLEENDTWGRIFTESNCVYILRIWNIKLDIIPLGVYRLIHSLDKREAG